VSGFTSYFNTSNYCTLPYITPHQSTSSLTAVTQNTSVILLVSEKIPHLLAWDTSHITRACTDTALLPSTSRQWARPTPDCQSTNGERSSNNRAGEREKEIRETSNLYLLLASTCGKATSHFPLFRPDARVQGEMDAFC